MDQQKVDMYVMSNAKYFESHHINSIRERMLSADDAAYHRLLGISLRDPVLVLVVSLVAGYLAIDRFMIGDVGLGIAKLLTCGGFGIWVIVDWFLIMGRTKEVNLEKLLHVI